MSSIIIENGHNTSYITSVLVSLFYNYTYLEESLLNRYTNNPKFIYLQELIKTDMVDKFRSNKSVFAKEINKIRYVSHLLGWKNKSDLFEEHSAKDYLCFILHNLDGVSYSKNIELAYYDVNAVDNSSVKKELELKIEKIFKGNIKLTKIFPLLVVHVNRDIDNGKLEIEKKIKINYMLGEDTIDIKWIFHSAICSNGKFYYSILNNNKRWYIFSNNYLPSFIQIDMSCPKVIDRIKSEVVVVMYRTDFY